MRILLETAPNELVAAEGLATSTTRYKAALALVAGQLHDLGHLKDGVTADRACDVLWFYFGYSGYFTLTDNGWTLDQAEIWLREQCMGALVGPPLR